MPKRDSLPFDRQGANQVRQESCQTLEGLQKMMWKGKNYMLDARSQMRMGRLI